MSDIEKRARDLLADEYARRGSPRMAEEIRGTELAEFGDDDFATAIRAVIAALTPPEGYVLVPLRPTIKMHNAAALGGLCGKPPTISGDGRIEYSLADPSEVYLAMIAARPEVGHE